MAQRLTAEQTAFFENEGYLLFHEPVLPSDEFDALRQHFERKLDDWQRTSGRSPEHMDVPHFTDPALFRWLFHDSVLDIVESLIGPDIALWSSHFICKPAGKGKRVPWHEDSAYWGKALDPMEVVTIWLAIDPSTPENGCMRVIPRTHHNGYSDYAPVDGQQVFGTEIKAGTFDENDAVDCVLAPNECSIHHAKLIHGSAPNTGTMRRCGYTMRYVSTASKHRDDAEGRPTSFQIYLARGRDRAGNTYGDPTKINEAYAKQQAGA